MGALCRNAKGQHWAENAPSGTALLGEVQPKTVTDRERRTAGRQLIEGRGGVFGTSNDKFNIPHVNMLLFNTREMI